MCPKEVSLIFRDGGSIIYRGSDRSEDINLRENEDKGKIRLSYELGDNRFSFSTTKRRRLFFSLLFRVGVFGLVIFPYL